MCHLTRRIGDSQRIGDDRPKFRCHIVCLQVLKRFRNYFIKIIWINNVIMSFKLLIGHYRRIKDSWRIGDLWCN